MVSVFQNKFDFIYKSNIILPHVTGLAIKNKLTTVLFFTFETYTNGAAYFKHRLKPFL